jgi:hypothetical protein
MSIKMPEVHVNITTNASGNQIVFHNPGQQPSQVGAGSTVTATVKPAGQANAVASGQVPNTSIVFRNPA